MRQGLLLTIVAAVVLWAGAAHAQQPGPVLVVGDSLEVGTGPRLKRELRGVEVTVDARSGRPSGEGLRVLRRLIRPSHRVVVFDLGTNDDPSRPGRLRSTLAAAREVAGKRCLVIATLVRPPRGGVDIDGMNRVVEVLASESPTVRLADWAAAAQSTPGLIGRDRVHATPNGYRERARVLTSAIRSCAEEVDDRGSSEERARHAVTGPEPGFAREGVVSALVELLPLDLPLGLLRGATELVEDGLRQAEGAVVPIAPDAVLGRERDPLGKRAR